MHYKSMLSNGTTYIGLNESLKFYVFGLGKKSNLETFKDNLHFEPSLPLLQ